MTDTTVLPLKSLTDRWLNRSGKFFLPAWLLALTLVITWGWSIRDQDYLTAENGVGYWLGIIGGSMMLLLLSYSVRKRLHAFNRLLSVKVWFQFHMALGVLGPLSILFHSNFHLGSLNSTVALVCMLLVAGSGIVGRYLYSKIHFGLYGEKIKLQQIRKDFLTLKTEIGEFVETEKQELKLEKLSEAIESLITDYIDADSSKSPTNSRETAKKLSLALASFIQDLEHYHNERSTSNLSTNEIHANLGNYSSILLEALRKLPSLQRFERLFSLWHVIHIPVFGLMICTAITHVVAVHMY